MTDEQIAPFLAKFDEADKAKSGTISIEEFRPLFSQLLAGGADNATADLYFRGIDVDDSKSISKAEFEDFVRAIVSKNQVYPVKLLFRAFDADRSVTLDAKEVKAMSKYTGKELTDEEIAAALERMTGRRNGPLTYPQVVKILTGKNIDTKADPYDGKLQSKCCLLL
jgi:Ca2+-binding EF-hand superfamily protein